MDKCTKLPKDSHDDRRKHCKSKEYCRYFESEEYVQPSVATTSIAKTWEKYQTNPLFPSRKRHMPALCEWIAIEDRLEAKKRKEETDRKPVRADYPLVPARVPPINIVCRLIHRSRYGSKPKKAGCLAQPRAFCTSLPLNTTIVSIDKPSHAAFIRKFTPDGRFLLTFCLQNNQVIIYLYIGIDRLGGSIATLIGERGNDKHEAKLQLYGYKDQRSIEAGSDNDFENSGIFRGRCTDVRDQAFNQVFRHYWTTDIGLPCPQSNRLNGECQWQVQKESALFTPDSRYVVVLTYSPLPRESSLEVEINRRTADAITTSIATQQVQILILDINERRITDRALMPIDKLAMAYNNGVQLVGYSILILSMQHQLVHLLEIDSMSGHLKRRRVIGTLTNQETEFDPHYNRLFILSELLHKRRKNGTSVVPVNNGQPANAIDYLHSPLLVEFVNTSFEHIEEAVLIEQEAGGAENLAPLNASDAFIIERHQNLLRDLSCDNAYMSYPTRRDEASRVNESTNFERYALTGLRQQLSAFFYRRYYQESDSWALIGFHRMADWLANLRICRAQFYGNEKRVVLRYTSEEVINKKWSSVNAASTAIADSNRDAPFLIVFYDVVRMEIENVYNEYNDELLTIYERNIDLLRHPTPSINPTDRQATTLPEHWCTRYPCTAMSNVHAKHAHEKHKRTLMQSCGNDKVEIARRLIASMPHASQSYNESPYLDMGYFRYDERSVPHIERPRQAADQALKFHRRNTGQPAFILYTGNGADEDANSTDSSRKGSIVYYIWHPREPLCFSVQRSPTSNQVNMHLFVDRSIMPPRSAENNLLIIK